MRRPTELTATLLLAVVSTFIGLDVSGELCVYSSVATNLLVDVSGWFST